MSSGGDGGRERERERERQRGREREDQSTFEAEPGSDFDVAPDVSGDLGDVAGDIGAGGNVGEDTPERRERQSETRGGRLSGVRDRLQNPISGRGFVLVLLLLTGGLLLGGMIPLVGWIGRFLGLFLAAFVVGLVSSRRRYAEVGLAGALATGASFLVSALGTVLFPVVANYGMEIAVVGVGSGLVVALLGHYFGRDLRDGLTRDV